MANVHCAEKKNSLLLFLDLKKPVVQLHSALDMYEFDFWKILDVDI